MAWPFLVPEGGDNVVSFLGRSVGGGGTKGPEPRKVSVETAVEIGWIREMKKGER